jgi:hypothetical protein
LATSHTKPVGRIEAIAALRAEVQNHTPLMGEYSGHPTSWQTNVSYSEIPWASGVGVQGVAVPCEGSP